MLQVKLVALNGFVAAPLWMTGTVLVMIGGAAASVSYPLGYRMMVNGLLHHHMSLIEAGVASTAGIFSLAWALTIVGSTQSAGLTDRVNIWLATRVAGLLATIPGLEHFERPDYLAEIELLTQNRRALAASPRLALSLFTTFGQTVAIAVILAGIDPSLAFLPVCCFAPMLGDDAAVRIQERTTQRLAERTRLAGELFSTLTTAAPAKELRVSGAQGELRARYDRLAREIQRATRRATLLGTACSAGGWLLYSLLFGGAIALLAVRASQGEASVGDVVMAIILIRRLQNQAGSLSDAFGQMITNFRTALRLVWLESLAERAGQRRAALPGRLPPARLRRGITLERVTFSYPGTDRAILRDISIHLPAGATVAIVGDNGAGKTTLAKLLLGLYEPSSGRIAVDDTSLADIDLRAWQSRCTAAFQDFVQFQLEAGRIVSVGDLSRLDDDEAVLRALEVPDGLDVLNSLDEGLATPVGLTFPAGRDLSSGQWQKLALARNAFPESPLLAVLDEPTASLDAQAEAVLFTRLAQSARHVTSMDAITIFVSHRFPSAKTADLILVLDQGALAEAGDHASLLAKGGTYREMFELQARAYR
jgi:ATP-binding cassette, subfamily B, bacterial